MVAAAHQGRAISGSPRRPGDRRSLSAGGPEQGFCWFGHPRSARSGFVSCILWRRRSATRAIISSFSAKPARNRVSPARTSVATTTSPDFSDGSSPPATPNEMTPLKVEESSVASNARNCCGSLELQMTIMPGPAAMRASCTNPVTIKTGRGSFELRSTELSTVAAAPASQVTSRPLPPCCWCFSNFGTAPAPRAERTSSSHDTANKTPSESL